MIGFQQNNRTCNLFFTFEFLTNIGNYLLAHPLFNLLNYGLGKTNAYSHYNTVNMFIHTGGMLYKCRDGIFYTLISVLTVASNNNDDDGDDAKYNWKCHISKLGIIESLFAI